MSAPREPHRSDGDGPSRSHGGSDDHARFHEEYIGGDCVDYDDDDGDDD